MQKIDFFGGLHGNFLELVVNVSINQNGYDITKPQFTSDGACHLKNKDRTYQKMIIARHFSYCKIPFTSEDQVIRIVPAQEDVFIGIINSFLRAGDQRLDIVDLDKDTLNKLSAISKGANFATTLREEFGTRVDYPRSVIRNYFYSMLNDFESGLGMFTNFDNTPTNVYSFPFRSLFDINDFYSELNKTSKFLGLNFYPTIELGKLHQEFLAFNQGYHSELKCKEIWRAILCGDYLDIKLNLIEEAWINYQAARCFRCYDLPLLIQDQYPSNTLEISQALFDWKHKDR